MTSWDITKAYLVTCKILDGTARAIAIFDVEEDAKDFIIKSEMMLEKHLGVGIGSKLYAIQKTDFHQRRDNK